MKDKKAFGNYLKNLRIERDLTINQVETYCGVSNSYLSLLENGKRNIPSAKILKKLANIYKVPYSELLKVAGYEDECEIAIAKETIPPSNINSDTNLKNLYRLIENALNNLKSSPLPPRIQAKIDNIITDTRHLLDEGVTELEVEVTLDVAHQILQLKKTIISPIIGKNPKLRKVTGKIIHIDFSLF